MVADTQEKFAKRAAKGMLWWLAGELCDIQSVHDNLYDKIHGDEAVHRHCLGAYRKRTLFQLHLQHRCP